MANIFKGPQFYREEESSNFKGREKEARDLLYIVEHSDFSVCYAVSGEGKSSLINAGLCPKLRDDGFLPIHIKNIADAEVGHFDEFVWERINASVKVEQLKERYSTLSIQKTVPNPDNNLLSESIWWKLRTQEFYKKKHETLVPVLIFDQFEEVFSSAKDLSWTDAFFCWLEQLYQDECPIYGSFSGILQKKFKIIFSLRSEYVCELDYWAMSKYFIPSLKNNRYYLKPLTKASAFEVANLLDGVSDSLNVDDVIKFAKAERTGEWEIIKDDIPCVSALILSLILTGLSEKDEEVESKIKDLSDSPSEKKGKELFDFLLDNVYKKALIKCDAANNIAVKNFVETLEDTLIDINGRRHHVSERELPQITDDKIKEALAVLEKERIINVIDHHYEISHDSLCPIIRKRKEERLEARVKEREEKLFKERRKKMIRKFLSVIALLIIGIIMVVIWSKERDNARKKHQGISVAYAANILTQRGGKFTAQQICFEQLESMQDAPHELELEFRKSLSNPSTANLSTSEWVRTLCFSPDGEKLITGSDDGKVIFWNVREGIPIDTIQAYDRFVFNVQMSSDGTMLMTSDSQIIKIWDTRTKQLKQQITPKGVSISSVAFSPDGKQIVTSSLEIPNGYEKQKEITSLWDTKTGNLIRTIRKSHPGNRWAEFSPDGKYIIGGDTDPVVAAYMKVPLGPPMQIPGPVTRFWDAKTGMLIKTLKTAGTNNGISPDIKHLLSIQENSVVVWDIETDEAIKTIKGHSDWIEATSYSSDGKYILTAADNTVKIWNATGDFLLYSMSGTGGILDAKISPDNKTIVASFGDKYIRILETENSPANVLNGNDGWDGESNIVTNLGDTLSYKNGILTYSPDGLYIANACSDECIRIWNAKTGEFYRKLVCRERYRDEPHLMAFSKDGKKIAAIYSGFIKAIKVWDIDKGEELTSRAYPNNYFWESIAFSPDSKQITLTHGDSVVYVWNWDKDIVDSIKIEGTANNAIFNPSGKHIAIATNNVVDRQSNKKEKTYDVIIVDYQSHRILKTIKRRSGDYTLSYSQDGKYILSSDYNTVVIWDVENGKKYKTLENEKNGFVDTHFSPDEKYVWANSNNHFVVWDVETRQIICSQQFERRFSDNVEWKTICPDGTITGGISGYIPTYTAITPNGGQYAYTDGTSIRIWNWPSLKELMDRVRMRFKHRKLTPEERKMYYLDD